VTDIIATMAALDSDLGWHKDNYWCHDDGTYTVDWWGDGDHEEIDAEELPSCEEIDRSWAEYAEFVAETGDDPLFEYTGVDYYRKTRQVWEVWFTPSIIGPILMGVRRGAGRSGGKWSREGLPRELTEYLNLQGSVGRQHAGDFRGDWRGFVEIVLKGDDDTRRTHHRNGRMSSQRGVRFEVVLVGKEARRDSAVERDLRKVARRHLRRLERRAA